jgi:carbon-monoxide dehydrogenase large subunit
MGGVAQGVGGSSTSAWLTTATGNSEPHPSWISSFPTQPKCRRCGWSISKRHPPQSLGVKGVGEAGCIPVPALTATAIDDALSHLGVEVKEMPLDPPKLLVLIDRNRDGQEVASSHRVVEQACDVHEAWLD